MKQHTYSLLMALIRLAKGGLNACESWVVTECKGIPRPTDPPTINHKVSEE